MCELSLRFFKGLSAIGDQECVEILSNIARSPDESSIMVSEAIMSLGEIPENPVVSTY